MMNKELNYGRDVKNTTAWCEQCIREAIICIEHLPADYYDDNDIDDGYEGQYRDAEGQDGKGQDQEDEGQDQKDEDQDQEGEGQNREDWGQQWWQWARCHSWSWQR